MAVGTALRNFLDKYGNQTVQRLPKHRSKTLPGAVLSIFARFAVVVLLVVCIIRLAIGKFTSAHGKSVVINARPTSLDEDGELYYDIPRLNFNQLHYITFYDKEAPTVQKISVKDLSGVQLTEFTSSTRVVNVTQSTRLLEQVAFLVVMK